MKALRLLSAALVSLLLAAAPAHAGTIAITPATEGLVLHSGDVLAGTGGPDTQIIVEDGATVTLRGVCITNITADEEHLWGGVTCRGDATIVLEGDNYLRGGHPYVPGLFIVPGKTLVIRGDGTLDARSNGYGAGIGGGRSAGMVCGDIVIEGGTIVAIGGDGAAGIGSGPLSACGNIVVSGGSVTATGGDAAAGIGSGVQGTNGTITVTGGIVVAAGGPYGAGIGSGFQAVCDDIAVSGGTVAAMGGQNAAGIGSGPDGTCGDIVLSGGTVSAAGGERAPGIGSGASQTSSGVTATCGDIALEEGVIRVTADGDSRAAVGAGYDSTAGAVTVGGVVTTVTDTHYVYAPCVLSIATTADWDAFASRVNRGVDSYDGLTVTLAADIAVSTPVGTNQAFRGTFEGGGHTLAVAIEGTGTWTAPFRYIDGATIRDLTVTGTVTSGGNHAAGLVGACGPSRPNAIRDCTVAVDVVADGTGYAGGIVGQGGDSTLALEGCVFSGSVSGFTAFAGGLLGWGNTMTLGIADCLVTGAFAPSGAGKFHPIACKFANRTVTATVSGAYWINTLVPTATGDDIVAGAAGAPVSATLVPGEWETPVAAADGSTYYAWMPAATGRLLAHLAFDDAGNAGANLLRAAVGLDAIVRATPATPVAGIGEIAAVADAGILSGLASGDGAVAIPAGQHLAVPIPAPLLPAAGRPYTVVMRIRVPDDEGWRSLLNMPASNDSDAMVYLHRTTRNIYLKQFDKSSGAGVAASNGNVPANRWTTLAFAFGEDATDVYLDGAHVLHATGALAGSYADCAASGGYILVGADDSGDDSLFHLSDFRIYEGAVAVAGVLPGSGTAADPYLVSSAEDWSVFAANVRGGFGSDACYRLDADIGPVSVSAGSYDHPFRGTFDGNGHTLDVALASDSQSCAPFGRVNGATIRDLRTTGTVTLSAANAYHASGLVGGAEGVTIERCRSSVAITFPSEATDVHSGGFIGHALSSPFTMTDCVFDGSIGGSENLRNVGGLVGWDDASTPAISNCLNAGTFSNPGVISRIARVGGRGTIANCFSTVNATSAGSQNDDRGAYTTATGTALRDLLGPGWMATGVASGSGFTATGAAPVPVRAMPPHDGSAYTIAGTADWDAFAASVRAGKRYLGQTVRLAADVAAASVAGTETLPFCGTFDGQGRTLDAALSGTGRFVAPFAFIEGATISNLTVVGTVSGGMHCAGLVGYIGLGTNLVADCTVAAAVTTTGSHCGGFVGHGGGYYAVDETLRGCVFAGSIPDDATAGTFYGWSDGGATTRLVDCLDASESEQPIGRGECRSLTVSNAYYAAASKATGGDRPWAAGKRGRRAFSVTEGEGVTIDFGAPVATYATSGIAAYATGIARDGVFYAGEGETVPFGLSATPPPGKALDGFAASAGVLSPDGDAWSLAMPAANVVVTPVFRSLWAGSGTAADPYRIATVNDWNALGNLLLGHGDTAGMHFLLATNLSVTTRLGVGASTPFAGVFDGGGHTLTVALQEKSYYVAPFSGICNATIANLAVAGTVEGGMHCAGLVGIADGENLVSNCLVSAAVTSTGSHFGGILGHGRDSTTELRGCTFSGTLAGGSTVATLFGWGDSPTVTLVDCLDASASPHPIGRSGGTVSVANTYFLAQKTYEGDSLWSSANRGRRGYAVTAAEGVAIDFGAPVATYGTGGIAACAPGIAYEGVFYAGEGETVSLSLASTAGGEPTFAVENGVLEQDGEDWILTMPAAPVVFEATFEHSRELVVGVNPTLFDSSMYPRTFTFVAPRDGWYRFRTTCGGGLSGMFVRDNNGSLLDFDSGRDENGDIDGIVQLSGGTSYYVDVYFYPEDPVEASIVVGFCATHGVESDPDVGHGRIETMDADGNPVNEALEGTRILLDAEPDNGYALTAWNVVDATGAPVSVRWEFDEEITYFRMPGTNVLVSATFSRAHALTLETPGPTYVEEATANEIPVDPNRSVAAAGAEVLVDYWVSSGWTIQTFVVKTADGAAVPFSVEPEDGGYIFVRFTMPAAAVTVTPVPVRRTGLPELVLGTNAIAAAGVWRFVPPSNGVYSFTLADPEDRDLFLEDDWGYAAGETWGAGNVDVALVQGVVYCAELSSRGGGATTLTIERIDDVALYPVVIDAAHATVERQYDNAPEGRTFPFTLVAAPGWAITNVVATDADGTELDMTHWNTQYNFEMPASAVTVTATFAPALPRYLDGAGDEILWNYDAWAARYGADPLGTNLVAFLLDADPAVAVPAGAEPLKVVDFALANGVLRFEIASEWVAFQDPNPPPPGVVRVTSRLGNGILVLRSTTSLPCDDADWEENRLWIVDWLPDGHVVAEVEPKRGASALPARFFRPAISTVAPDDDSGGLFH